MQIKYPVYNDIVIAVALFAEDESADQKSLLNLAIRWLPPQPLKGKDGKTVETTNIMGGETDWFILPHSFGVAVGRRLIEQKVADSGLAENFDENGFKRMVSWLVEMNELCDAMCY